MAKGKVAPGEMHVASTSEKKREKVLRSLEIKQGENGGHIVEHNFDNSGPGYGYHEPEHHVFGATEGEAALSHIAKHAKISRASAKTEKVVDKDEDGE